MGMKIEHIVATMNRENTEFLKNNNYTIDATVINQTNKNEKQECYFENIKITLWSYKEIGLSKSRNRGIENSKADICIISDDDIRYKNDVGNIVKDAYIENPEFDIIVFQVKKNENELYKDYYKEKRVVKFFEAMKVSSVEMTFKKSSFEKYGIKFDENFGAGSKFFMGEENILLSLALKQGLKILYIPIVIGTLLESESTWFIGYDKNYFISRGASFAAISIDFSYLFILQFAFRKYKLYKNKMSLKRALIYMFEGRKKYSNNN